MCLNVSLPQNKFWLDNNEGFFCDLYSAFIFHHHNWTLLSRATLEHVGSLVYQDWMAVMGQEVNQDHVVSLVWMVSVDYG